MTAAIKYTVPSEINVRSRACWCGGVQQTTLYTTDRWGQSLQTVVCTACGTIRLDPRMDREQATLYYATMYPDGQRAPEEFFKDQAGQRCSEYLQNFLRKDMRILDYGCGPGGKLTNLLARGIQVRGLDLNPKYRAFAESRGIRPPQQGEKFDAIYLSHTIEHWTDPAEDLHMILQTFAHHESLVIIEVPLIDRLLLGGRRDGIYGDVYFVHAWYFSVRSLDKMLRSLGCERVFTDRLTLCVYKLSGSPSKSVVATPLQDAALRRMIGWCSHPVIGFGARLVNRVIGYIDLTWAARLNSGPESKA